MWKARKIELKSNKEVERHSDSIYFTDLYTLKINDVPIHNCIGEKLTINYPNEFQNWVCDFCGESCSAGCTLCIRRHEKSLLFIPCFDMMNSFVEYDGCAADGNYGSWDCPPHEWYEHGILEVDETMLPEFLRILKGFDIENIPFITDEEMDKMLEWEILVKDKPAHGFMRLE